MSLEPADGDGLVLRAKDARTFTQFLNRAYARTGGAKQI
jgi:hypothetical protein